MLFNYPAQLWAPYRLGPETHGSPDRVLPLARLKSGVTMRQAQEEINRRVLERAAQVLTPEQLKSYGEFQFQQLEMQKFGMKMAQQMFGTNGNLSVRDVKFEVAPVK